MCGIAGIFPHDASAAPVDAAELLRTREAMVARGPDGAGLWMSPDRRVGLAHRRLSIIDLSDAGAQPMATADGMLQVVFNGEIYNYRELRKQLEARGRRFRSASDTEVLLHLYAEYGQGMVEHLRGMYAFAIWDERRKGLLLARDPFGIKPLYYADDGKTLRFASQVKALLKGGAVSTEAQPAGHVGFFLWGYVPEPYTLYRDIHALPAGSTLWADGSGARKPDLFFDLNRELVQAEEQAGAISAGEIHERLREAAKDTIRHHLIADVPVGVFLSSGLDSSTITAIASETSDARLHAVTLGFDEYRGTDLDETVLATAVARHYGVIHQNKWVSQKNFSDNLDGFLDAMDQPTVDGINTFFVSKVAAQAGMKVALSGLGGDELLGGYPSFRDVPRIANLAFLLKLPPSVGKAMRWVSAPLLKRFTSSKYAGLLEYGGSYGGAYLLRRGLYMPWELPEFLDGEIVKAGWGELQPLLRLEETVRGIASPRLRVTALELQWYMRNQLLRDSDWAGMAHSLEIRVPFVDIEFFRRLLPLMAFAQPPGKRDMALTPGKPLLPEVMDRPKTGFAVPVREWLLKRQPDGNVGRGLRLWAHKVNPWPKAMHWKKVGNSVKRVLIYRLGSLGDTVVALPALHLIANTFPNAERRALTNFPVAGKAAPLSAVLGDSGLVHGYFVYSIGLRSLPQALKLRREIRAWRPELLIYLTAPRGRWNTFRDLVFFRLMGISTLIGAPVTKNLEENWLLDQSGQHEQESARLARCLEEIGEVRLADPANWDLHLTPTEIARADQALTAWPGRGRFIACSAGTKMDVKDWGEANWCRLMKTLGAEQGDYGLAFVGAAEEHAVSERVGRAWPGPVLNLCGALSPRESAALLKRADIFIGHDSGPMHLAASVNVPCVAIFSARDKPGVWFPYGSTHQVIYHKTPCFNCKLEICTEFKKACILSITVDEVLHAIRDAIQKSRIPHSSIGRRSN